MNPLNILKANFELNLQKQGSSLQELEEALSGMDNVKKAEAAGELLKVAFLDKLNPLDMAGTGAKAYGTYVLGSGYLGGTVLDKADQKIKDENTDLQLIKDKISLLKRLTHRVKTENV